MTQVVKPGATTQTTIVGAAPSAVEERLVAPPGLLDVVAWRDAAIAWLAQRLILVVLTYLVLWQAIPHPGSVIAWPTLSQVLHVWTEWDSGTYASIAEGGYTQLQQAAFFPLYPFLERQLTPLVGGNALVAGLVIANAACLIAFALLRVLVEREYGRAVARRTLLYLVIFPYSLFLVAAYTEALFLLLTLGVFLALQGRHWKVAGILAALATLTRPIGIMLLVPLLYGYWTTWIGTEVDKRRRPLVAEVMALLLPALALIGFEFALVLHFRTLVPSAAAEASVWRRSLTWPWNGIFWAGSAVLHEQLIVAVFAALDIAWILLFSALALASVFPADPLRSPNQERRQLLVSYGLFAIASALLVLTTPVDISTHRALALASSPRYMGVVFPLFLLLARWGSTRLWLHRLIVVSFLTAGLLVTVGYLVGAFVG